MGARLVFADEQGTIYDHPGLRMAGRSGQAFRLVPDRELIPLPPGSELFALPGRHPIGYDAQQRRFITLTHNPYERGECLAVAAFMAPAHTLSYVSAYRSKQAAPVLPLFAYAAVGWKAGRFWVAGWRTDPDIRQDFDQFDCQVLAASARKRLAVQPTNRLLQHLSRCALTHGCPAARNLFLGRWEAPLPTSPSCNARCLGCLSHQSAERFPASQPRITFVPSAAEIAEVAAPHLEHAPRAVASFGQGCEGEPLLQGPTLEQAIRLIRAQTSRGTINLNTNASLPQVVATLVDVGLDSLRVSVNSVRPSYYQAYYRPRGYSWPDVVTSIHTAKAAGARVSLNYLIFPGLNDEPEEIQALEELLASTGLDCIQLRNLNLDPEYYLKGIGFCPQGRPLGIRSMVRRLQKNFPSLRFGYFNPPWRELA